MARRRWSGVEEPCHGTPPRPCTPHGSMPHAHSHVPHPYLSMSPPRLSLPPSHSTPTCSDQCRSKIAHAIRPISPHESSVAVCHRPLENSHSGSHAITPVLKRRAAERCAPLCSLISYARSLQFLLDLSWTAAGNVLCQTCPQSYAASATLYLVLRTALVLRTSKPDSMHCMPI